MNVTEAIVKLQELQDTHGGDLPLVDVDGDLIKFSHATPGDTNEWPYPVVVVTFADDEDFQ